MTRPGCLRIVAATAVALVVLAAVCIGVLVYAGLRMPEPPIAGLSTRAELAARLPPAPRGARLIRTAFEPARGCPRRCAVYSRTYGLSDRLVTVEVACAAYFDALEKVEASGYELVDDAHPTDRDGCETMLVPQLTALMQRDDGVHRKRFVFEAFVTTRLDAIVFAAAEPPPGFEKR